MSTSYPQLRLFGAPAIERNGRPVELETRKALALIAYLVLSGKRHTREHLSGFLWPDADQFHASGSLRRVLSVLNAILGEAALEADRQFVGVGAQAALGCDVTDFQRAREDGSVAALERAAALYRGDFMAGFSLAGSPDYETWQLQVSEQLRRELGDVLERLADAHAAAGAHAKAIAHARRWLALDALNEPAHRCLMRLHALHGDRPAALRQYRECVRVLEQELGVAPLEETTRLYEHLRERAEPPTPPRPSPVAAGRMEVPLVAREDELRALTRAWQNARAGALFVIEGEAGIGKTRLADAVVAEVESQGGAIARVRCFAEEAGHTLGPLLEVMRAAHAAAAGRAIDWPVAALSEASRLFPDWARLRDDVPPPAPQSPGSQSRFYEGVCAVLARALAEEQARPGLIILDDAQWIDSATLEWLAWLVHRLARFPLCVLLTWRSEDVPADHALRALLAQALRDARGTALTLRPFSPSAVAQLAQLSGRALSPAQAGRLYRDSDGLPLFVVEFLAVQAELPEDGVVQAGLPRGVRDLLHSRVVAVGEAARQVLTAAAIIGRAFDFETARLASGRSEAETVTALEALIARGLIHERAGSYEFHHETLRVLLHDEATLTRRRLLHQRVAAALIARAQRGRGSGPMAARIARHLQNGGQDAEAAGYFQRAGDYARTVYANAEALGYYQSALALGFDDTAGLHEAMGDLHTLAGRYDAALAALEACAALSPAERLADIEHKLGNVHARRGDFELAASHYQAALGAAGSDAHIDLRARITADWSLAAHRAGNARQALILARKSLALARRSASPAALAQAHNTLGILLRAGGDGPAARRALERSLALAAQPGDAAPRVAVLNNLALVCLDEGAADRALALIGEAIRLCEAQGDRHREAALRNNLADALRSMGRTADAIAELTRAVALFAEVGASAAEWQPEIWKLTEW